MNAQYYIEYDANRLTNMRNRSSIMNNKETVYSYINEKRRIKDYNFVHWRILEHDGIKSTVIESGTESKELLLG